MSKRKTIPKIMVREPIDPLRYPYEYPNKDRIWREA